MNSSISGSDISGADAASPRWRKWIGTFCAVLIGGIVVLYLTVVLVDPFSTGRFGIVGGTDVTISDKAWANAGRSRDPQFDFAIIGNSHARFEPNRLDAITGHRFVLLTAAGTGSKEQIAAARAFLRHHHGLPIGLLWVLDYYWCTTDESLPSRNPDFPFWLYDSNNLEYLTSVFSSQAVQATFHRIGIRLLGAPPAGRADGYTPNGVLPTDAMTRVIAATRPTHAPTSDTPFPSADRMEAFLAQTGADVRLILMFTPNYISFIPEPETAAARRLAACKQRFKAMAEQRPHATFLDYMRDDDVARDPGNFLDATHARDPVFEMLEADIARAVRAKMNDG